MFLFFSSFWSQVIDQTASFICGNESQHERTRKSHIRFLHAFSHRFFSREFRVLISDPLHSYNCKIFFPSLSYFFLSPFRHHRQIFSRSLSLFTFPIFLRGTYLRVDFLQLAHEARHVTLFRYIFTISFFPLFSISSILRR